MGKKVLIIAYPFPPRPEAGSQRLYALARYLPESGWEPIVLTADLPGRPPEGIRVIETPYKDIIASLKSKFGFNPDKNIYEQMGIDKTKNFAYSTLKSKGIKLFKEVFAYPDEWAGWYKFAFEAASKILSDEKIDIILSSSSPETSNLIANALKRKFKIPWIADFRDLWTQNHYYEKNSLVRYFEKRLEYKTLSNADALVTVSEPLVKQLESLHKGKKVYCATNGYARDILNNSSPNLTEKFTITYTGDLYIGKRDPSLLFRAIGKLIEAGIFIKDSVEIRFYLRFSSNDKWLLDEIKRYHLEEVVKVHDFIPREEALKIQRESQLLLLLLWFNEKEAGVYTGKVFEYLAAKRPIMAVGMRGNVVQDLLKRTGAGGYVSNAKELETYLIKVYDEYKMHGYVRYAGNHRIDEYSYQSIIGRYAKILDVHKKGDYHSGD